MPNTYKEETYKEVCLWTADTKIKYAPNPKSGKSQIRYEKYMKAKTVAEALKFGTKSQDLFYDFEHGHLSVRGGPKRKVPLHMKDRDSSWTKVDVLMAQKYMAWQTWKKTFQLADKLGVDRRQLTRDKTQGENPEVRSKRLQAVEMARMVLKEVQETKRKITDRDVLAVLRLWGFKENTTRLNVMQEGETFVYSDTLGLVAGRDASVLVTAPTTEYPEVTQVFSGWLRDHVPPELKRHGFGFSSINVNANYAGRLHRDGNNQGPSMIKAFGEFSGGELNYWEDDDKTLGPVDRCCSHQDRSTLDIKKNLCLFDGNRGHSVEAFKGERFSLVFFCIGLFQRASPKVKAELARCGVNFPSDQGMAAARSLLGKPRGYKTKAGKPVAGREKPAMCMWPVADKRAGTDFTSARWVAEAKRVALDAEKEFDECKDRTFVGHKCYYNLLPDGRRTVRWFVTGTSGGQRLAATGEEEKAGIGRYLYARAEGFDCGPKLHTNQIRDVREWLAKVVNKPDKNFGSKKCVRSASATGETATPVKRQRLA